MSYEIDWVPVPVLKIIWTARVLFGSNST
ncbi:MAG: hypothetical protein QOG12_2200, partial [Verrucomicrobiota bacterium]